LKRYTLSLALMFALVLSSAVALAGEERVAAPEKRSHIDLVVALDTSNSMDGLIDSARQKIWDLVSEMATAKPTPILRVGLISYGNDGYKESGWTRVDQDLTTDLDAVFEKLMALKTNGGTEYVGRAIHVARTEMNWRKDRSTLKLMFVAGNESADQDLETGAIDEAGKIIADDIVVNTIYCGQENHADASSWRKVAQRADGRFAAISADGGAVVVATPYDDKILELNDQLNGTYVAYGKRGKDKKRRQKAADKSAASVSKPAAVARSGAKATKLYNNSDWDLVDAEAGGGGFALEELEADDLPDEMRDLKPAERKSYVAKKSKERTKIQKELAALNKKRTAHVKKELEKKGVKKDQAFDAALSKALREQAAEKGIAFE
jgi:hypothetical protein